MAGRHKKRTDHTFYQNLGRAIRLARVAAGKSQADVAELLDLSPQQVQKYEKAANRIPVEELVSLAAYLDVSVSDLVDPSATDAEFKALAGKFRAKGFQALLESWGAIKDQPMRAAILNMIKCAAAMSRR